MSRLPWLCFKPRVYLFTTEEVLVIRVMPCPAVWVLHLLHATVPAEAPDIAEVVSTPVMQPHKAQESSQHRANPPIFESYPALPV